MLGHSEIVGALVPMVFAKKSKWKTSFESGIVTINSSLIDIDERQKLVYRFSK